MLVPHSPTRTVVWNEVEGTTEVDGGVMQYEASLDTHVLSKFIENGYRVNLMVDHNLANACGCGRGEIISDDMPVCHDCMDGI
jgi:hypothetical protein